MHYMWFLTPTNKPHKTNPQADVVSRPPVCQHRAAIEARASSFALGKPASTNFAAMPFRDIQKRREYDKKRNQNPVRKAARKAYSQSDHGKAVKAAYEQTDSRKAAQKAYQAARSVKAMRAASEHYLRTHTLSLS